MPDRSTSVQVDLTVGEKERLRSAAESRYQTMSEFVREALRREWDRMDAQKIEETA